MPIVFIHCWQANNWEEVLAEQIQTLKSSGLDNYKVCYNDNEKETLIELWKFSKDYTFPILHIHAKGLSHYGTKYEEKANRWRRWLMQGVVEDWENYVKLLPIFEVVGDNLKPSIIFNGRYWVPLESNSLTAIDPLNGKSIFTTHFSGNFWWADPLYLSTLPKPCGDRKDIEMWACSGNGRFKEIRNIKHNKERDLDYDW